MKGKHNRRYSDNDVIREAQVFLRTPGGVQAVAELLKMPRSTVHWHVDKRLVAIDKDLWWEVRKRIAYNKKHHPKGGRRK